ncbi:MAG: hypothetical protein GY790_18075 [Bacteroidetes bacterium]|nr:hypothetical protein [Bacteroidota bacterium]
MRITIVRIKHKLILSVFTLSLICNCALAQSEVQIELTAGHAIIENSLLAIEFDLSNGSYSGIDKSDHTLVFKDAWFRVGQGGWTEPKYSYKAERLGSVVDNLGSGEILRVWYLPHDSYDPSRFLDITVYQTSPFFVIGWGVKNNKDFTIRARRAEVLLNGVLFENQKYIEPRVLRGGAGAEPNFVESTWEIEAHNSAMLSYKDNLSGNKRRTIVAGGLAYAEFMRTVEFHKKAKGRRDYLYKLATGAKTGSPILKQSFMTLMIHDPQGKRIEPGELWTSKDSYYVDIVSADPFISLERYGKSLAKANNANPNAYDFPTLCGWMTSMKEYGDGTPTNNSAALVKQMKIALDSGITNYTTVALRLEPDYYCYSDDGNTQQGWWDDEHWSKYGSLQKPYETFSKFAGKIDSMGGKVFTYVQGSMPSNDFALAHPDWMLNDDISLLYEDHLHARTLVRYDFTNSGFQDYLLKMWTRLGKDGVVGIKFDYPESGWAKDGGFDDKTYTTISAYRKIFELCREGMGEDAYIHERIMGFKLANVPRTDCNAGVVDLQRVWPDASHFEPEMSSRIGLRWYKQGTVFRYYPDGKSFHQNGVELDRTHRRTFLTMIGLLSGRIELGTSFGKLTEEMRYDLTRLFPVLPNGKSFRPADLLLEKTHPEVYVYTVDEKWKQVILVNNDVPDKRKNIAMLKTISAPVSGDQANTGSLDLNSGREYYVFDFWNQKPLGIIAGTGVLSADLLAGEALVYSLRQVENYPQILGTNRHVMCGMMELSNTTWDRRKKRLEFTADLIKGETMILTIAIPEGAKYRAVSVKSSSAQVSFEQSGQFIRVSASSGKNGRSNIELFF